MIYTHRIPAGEEPSVDYAVTVDGAEVGVYQCRVSAIPFCTVWPGQQRSLDQTEMASFLYFSMDGGQPVNIRIKPRHDFKEAVIRPLSRKIVPEINDNTIVFTVDKPGHLTLELDGHSFALHIFINPHDEFNVDKNAANVIYFGPGVHHPGPIDLEDNQILYVDDGAVVHTGIDARNKRNIRVLGHGIIDNSEYERKEGSLTCYRATNCENVEVCGVIFRDASSWTLTATGCVNLICDNIKMIGMWRYNSDGIDFVNSRNALVQNCFLRNYDDCVVLKGYPRHGDVNVENITVRKCVLWCDWGRTLEVGAETCAPEYRGIIFEDCDIIHTSHVALDIQNSGYAHVHNVIFRDIRVEYSKYQREPIYQQTLDMEYSPAPGTHLPRLMVAEVTTGYADMFAPGCVYGRNSEIYFENIQVIADEGLSVPPSIFVGHSDISNTRGIHIKDLYFNGEKLDSLKNANITVGKSADNVKIC